MHSHRRARLLKALDLEVWTRRAAPGSVAIDEPATPSDARIAAGPPPPWEVSEPSPVAIAAARPAVRSAPRQPAAAQPLGLLAEPEPAAPPYVAPADWAGLAAAVSTCTRCKLCKTRTKTVFGVGPEDAPLMVIGEGPGADEDQRGEPFVGAAGKLLDEMLNSIGRTRASNVYIANVVKCRPPGNRDPEADEVAACRPFLDRQIELLKPRLILALGRIAAQRLLGSSAPLSKLRGPLHRYGAAATPVQVSYHPAYLLRTPADKAKTWADLKDLHRVLAAAPAAPSS